MLGIGSIWILTALVAGGGLWVGRWQWNCARRERTWRRVHLMYGSGTTTPIGPSTSCPAGAGASPDLAPAGSPTTASSWPVKSRGTGNGVVTTTGRIDPILGAVTRGAPATGAGAPRPPSPPPPPP
jgi:hypothetical protein